MPFIDKELAIQSAVDALKECPHMTAVRVAFALNNLTEVDEGIIAQCDKCRKRLEKEEKEFIISVLDEVLKEVDDVKFEIDDTHECLYDAVELADLTRIIKKIKSRYK